MIEVIQPGIHTSIQDRGRFGYRDQGVPLSGAMDQYSSHLSNQIVGNHADEAVMEFVLQGPTLYFHRETSISITGGEWDIELNEKKVKTNEVIHIPNKSRLKIKGLRKGMYGYLAVRGGFQTQKVLNSYSYYPEITAQAKLSKGDKLPFNQMNKGKKELQNASIVPQEKLLDAKKLNVEKGPEFELLNSKTQSELFEAELSPSKDSNRMAYPLQHELELTAEEITTGIVQVGTVQLTPSGKLIVLMRDAQTSGGYARILQLSPMAINQLAQKRPGEHFKFSL